MAKNSMNLANSDTETLSELKRDIAHELGPYEADILAWLDLSGYELLQATHNIYDAFSTDTSKWQSTARGYAAEESIDDLVLSEPLSSLAIQEHVAAAHSDIGDSTTDSGHRQQGVAPSQSTSVDISTDSLFVSAASLGQSGFSGTSNKASVVSRDSNGGRKNKEKDPDQESSKSSGGSGKNHDSDEPVTGGDDNHTDDLSRDTIVGGDGSTNDTVTSDGHGDSSIDDTISGGTSHESEGDGFDQILGYDTVSVGDSSASTMSGNHCHDDGDHSGHGGGGHDHSDPALTPPGVGASQTAINAYVQALGDLPDGHSHSADAGMAGEHEAAMALVARDEATHVAIGDGDWFDPNVWANGEVPGDDAKVLIPHGVHLNYGGVSDASLFTVRIDGTLEFATDENSQMIFDTMLSSPTGHLIIGTADNPVQANVDVDLIVADNGRIDTSWDPMLLSRGIIAHGTTTIHGADKDSHEKVSDDPMAGDTSVQMAGGVPTGWQVGDTIVIAGTHYDGWSGNRQIYHPPEDEVRTITQIDDDGRIHFEEALVHDHDSPRADLKTSVANYTRNVSVESENAEDLEVFERGHVMFMHSDNVDVRYAEFTELGRTDKSEEARDISNIDNVRFDSNVQGRYSLHLHRTGTSDIDNPTVLEGNAVFGSPGWGIVHHDSNAVITNNATYDTFGAGYVAETGNETGVWDDNIAIFAQGVTWETPKNTSEIGGNIFDTARGGEGFWFQGRMVASTNNIAASVNNGFAFFHRDGDGRMIEFDASLFAYDAALYFNDDVRADDVPILGFQGNEAFAANQGLHVVKANPNQGHDIWSHLDDFTAWSVVNGAHIEYTSHYLLTNFDVVGKEDGFYAANTGIKLGNNVTEVVIRDVQVDGFETGIDLNKVLLHDPDSDLHNYAVIDALISNVENAIANQDLRDTVTTSDELPGLTPDLELDELSYQHSDTYSESVVNISGTKSDSLGMVDFPGGSDSFSIFRSEVVNILETQGYYSTTSGQNYFLVDIYLTDRATGEIFYETHPVFISSDTLSRGPYLGALYNGGQNITYLNGQEYAGDQVLDVPIPASPTSGITYSLSDYVSTTVDVSLEEEYWLEGYSGTETLSIDVRDGIFVNTGDARNIDLHVEGGEAVLTANNGTLEFGDSRDFQIFGSEAAIGFDGTNGQTAILDFDQGSNLTFVADEDGLGKIQEIDSSGLDGTANVLSGIDLGHSTLTIELSGLSSVAGTQFVLMDADEIVGIFEEAVVGGLGARNAVIVVDYEQDVVSLELTEGEGNVTVETVGSEADGDIHVLFYELMRADLDDVNCKTVSHIYSEEVDEEGISGLL